MSILKYALTFVGGAALGFVASSLFYKKKIKSLEREFDEMDSYYQEKNPKVAPYVKKEETPKNKTQENGDAKPSVSGNSIVRGRMEYKKPDYVEYDKIFTPSNDATAPTDPAEKESPEDDYEESYSQGLVLNKEREANKVKPPKLIKANEYGDQPGFNTIDLHYYQENDFLTVVSDMGEEDLLYVDEIEDYVGDALIKFDFKNSDEKTIYVRNYQRGCDFMISKVFGAFGE